MKWISNIYHKIVGYDYAHPKYQVGQVWAYKTRAHEPDSALCILHVDKCDRIGYIFHVCIYNLVFKNPHIEAGVQDALPFNSFDEASLDQSLTEQTGFAIELPDTEMLYADWQHQFKFGDVDPVINRSIAECLQEIEDSIAGSQEAQQEEACDVV